MPDNLDAVANSILASIAEPGDDAPLEGYDPASPTDSTEAAPAAPETSEAPPAPAENARDQSAAPDTEPPAPAIEPPAGLTDDEKALWGTLPPAAQKIIERRERDRTSEFRRGQDEVASLRKAAEQERLRLAQSADQFARLAETVDPVLAEGRKTDWVALSKSDPVAWIEKRAAYEQRENQFQAAIAMREQSAAQGRAQMLADEDAKLVAKIPEWSDPDKGRAEYKSVVESVQRTYGFKPEEMQISDHRLVLVARDAMRYHALMAERKATETKKAPAPVPQVVRPGNANTTSADDRAAALKQRAAKTSDLHEKAAILARMF